MLVNRDDTFHSDKLLDKALIKFLEGKLIQQTTNMGRVIVTNDQPSGARISESDERDMEVFLYAIHQLLPILGSDILTPAIQLTTSETSKDEDLLCQIKGLVARGRRTLNGFVVFKDSQAARENRPSAKSPMVARKIKLKEDRALIPMGDHLRFARDVEFSSPSTAAAIVHGGEANGLTAWQNSSGITLKELEDN